jgi:DNA repair exonuclease SbcCD ATPase subunit
MKRYSVIIILILSLSSCQQGKIDQMQVAQDSITQAIIKRDSTILDFVASMNEIQDNLDSIKRIQSIVKIQSNSGNELQQGDKDRIVSDIRMINDLLQKNKDLIAQLQRQANSSGMKIAELQKAIVNLNRQVEEKNAEIVTLREELQKLNFDMEGLNVQLKTAEEKNISQEKVIQEKTQAIEEQTTAMNMAWYAFGTKKELVSNGVIEKEGGILGLGRTLQLKEDFNREFFTQVDIRDLKSIPLFVKKAVLITTHTVGSYHFTGEDEIESLDIDNPKEFWKTSKYLVIAID